MKEASVAPLVEAYRMLPDTTVIDLDLEQWARCLRVAFDDPEGFLRQLLSSYREFRNVFYWRLEHLSAAGAAIALAARHIWRPIPSLDLACEHIGPGLVVRHGYGTILTAESIGANCWVHQQVTVGWDYEGGRPSVGDDVFIGAGAKILGAVVVGNGARIGANAVVMSDVPPGATVVGVPAKVVSRRVLTRPQ